MESLHSPNTTNDATLEAITQRTREVSAAVVALYESIREAKENGYAYSELGVATGFPRGTLQNIVSGKNPRLSVEQG
jgi:hypothetical protein